MTVKDKITLNLSGDNRLVRVQAKQGDISSRFVEIDFEHDGVPFPISDHVTARAEFFRPDKTHVLNDEAIKNRCVLMELTQQMLAVAGEASCEIQLYEGDTVISSAVFTVIVTPCAVPKESVESDPDYSSFENALAKLEGINNDASISAAEAKASAETAKGYQETAANYANAAKESQSAANKSADDAINAKNGAESAANQAKIERDTATASAAEAASSALSASESKDHVDEVAQHIDSIIGGKVITQINGQSADASGNITLAAADIPAGLPGTDAATVQEAVNVLKQDADGVREYFTPEGEAISAAALNGISGKPVAPYVHTKTGTVHNLTGPSGAALIYFTATDVYQDGDTWTLNGTAVTATYHDGQALLPTAVIAGDVVEAAVNGDTVRLMLQKLTPQKNILINANFKDPVNQRQAKNVEAFQYGIDKWACNETSHTVEDGYLDIPAGGVLTYRFDGLTASSFLGKMVTVCIALEDGLHIGSNIYNGEATTNFIDDSVVSGYKYGTDKQLQFLAKKPFKARFVKVELGNRYTGWHDPSPGETLAECQRYQLAVNGSHYFSGGVYSARGSTYVIPTPVTMRAKPVLTKWVVKYGAIHSNGNAGGVLTASVTDFSENSIKVDVSVNKDLTLGPSVLREATFFFDANL